MTDWSGCAPTPPDEFDDAAVPPAPGFVVKEYLADFDTPLVSIEGPGSITARPDTFTFNMLVIPTIGPDAISDASKGFLARVWKVDASVFGEVWLSRSTTTVEEWQNGDTGTWEAAVLLFTYNGTPINEVDVGFDQNGGIVVCAERSGEVWIFWQDPRVGDYVFDPLVVGRTPRILLDSPQLIEESDLLLFYINDATDRVEFRVQRELYEVVHDTPVVDVADAFLEEAAFARDNRLHLIGTRRDAVAGTYEIWTIESAPYPAVVGDQVEQVNRVEDITTTVVVYVQEFMEALDLSARILTLTAIDLFFLVGPDAETGRDGRIDLGQLDHLNRVRTINVTDLSITPALDFDSLDKLSRIMTLTTTVIQLVVQELDVDGINQSNRIQTIVLT